MASYEEQLETFGKMIDEEEEKKKRGRTRSKVTGITTGGSNNPQCSSSSSSVASSSAVGTALGSADGDGAGTQPQTFKAQPQVRVVGFQVSASSPSSSSSTMTAPVAIPSSAGSGGTHEVRAGRGKRAPADNESPSPTSTASTLGRSLEELKEYKSQLNGWSSEGGTGTSSATAGRRTPPISSSPGQDHSAHGKPASPTALGGSKLSSSSEGRPTVSPKQHPPYQPFQPLVSPSASKPMTSPLHTTSSPTSATAIPSVSTKPPKKLGTAQKSRTPTTAPTTDKSEHEDSDDDTTQSEAVLQAKKPLTRAERRAIQEAQRAAKQARQAAQKSGQPVPANKSSKSSTAAVPGLPGTGGTAGRKGSAAGAGGVTAVASSAAPPKTKQLDEPKSKAQAPKQPVAEEVRKQVELFSHLPQFERRTTQSMKIGFSPSEKIHPAIVNLGLKYAGGTVTGSNSRCVAMLTAFKKVIRDFQTPPGTALHRTLEPHLKPQIQFLTDCRPHSISMGNAINYIKREIPKTQGMSDEEAKEFLIRRIKTFIEERIILADRAIATYGVSKINDNDVILIYAASHPVECVLKLAHSEGRNFRVILVESTPKREAKNLMQKLVKEGIHCTLVLLNAVSYVMKEVAKVFLGAATLLVNGHLLARAGTAMVAMVANAYNVPVIVCCETYKFCERVQIDSICFNELGDPEELIHAQGNSARAESLKDWRENKNLKLLNLVYDVTPGTFITMVITEVGMLPPSSVPVILREYPLQSMEQIQ